jgi:hypothetical protein
MKESIPFTRADLEERGAIDERLTGLLQLAEALDIGDANSLVEFTRDTECKCCDLWSRLLEALDAAGGDDGEKPEAATTIQNEKERREAEDARTVTFTYAQYRRLDKMYSRARSLRMLIEQNSPDSSLLFPFVDDVEHGVYELAEEVEAAFKAGGAE